VAGRHKGVSSVSNTMDRMQEPVLVIFAVYAGPAVDGVDAPPRREPSPLQPEEMKVLAEDMVVEFRAIDGNFKLTRAENTA
jgi:hypothetical protein